MTRPGYALVTPARNERANLERLAGCVLAQELQPVAWIIVDDASDDGTDELARELAAEHAWIRVVGTDRSADALASGRRQGRALDSFRRGVEALAGPVEVVVKVDADTSFDPAYFRSIVGRFAAEPDLGIAGGACYEEEDGVWVRQKVIATHPRGASRAYRWPLMSDVMALESRMGWDGLDEVKARMRGYRSAVQLDLEFKHHRPTGARERDRLRHFAAQGRAAWYMGYRPSYLLLRTLYRSPREPAAVGMVWGFLAAGLGREPRCPEPDVIRHLRDEQRVRAVLRMGAPP
jgi:glycosyltransferase involved in cell wall biosynthesis